MRARRRACALGVILAWSAIGCRTPTPPAPPAVVASASAPARFTLPAATRASIDADLARANALPFGAAPALTFEEAAPLAGLVVERYTIGRGPTLLFAADEASTAITVQLHFALDTLSPDAARAVLELARWPEGSDELRRVEQLGGRARAGASGGIAWLSVTCPTEGPPGVDVLAEIVRLQAERLAREVTVGDASWSAIAARIRKHRTIDPKTMLERALTDRWPMTSGRTTAFDELDRPAAEAALHALFAPKNAVIAVSGPVDRAALLGEVRRRFGPLASKLDVTSTGAPQKVEGTRTATAARPAWFSGSVSVPGDSEVLLLAWPIPRPITLADHIALDAIAHILADGEESRLGRTLLARDGLGVEARVKERAAGGTFELFIALQPGRTATQAIALVDREVRTIARGETTGIEVEVVRASLRRATLEELTTPEARASRIARSWIREHDLDLLDRRLDALTKLGEPEVRAVAARWLGPKPRAELTGRPRATPMKGAR